MNNLITPGIDVDSLSVLVVDDVPLNILLIKKMLSQYTFEILPMEAKQPLTPLPRKSQTCCCLT